MGRDAVVIIAATALSILVSPATPNALQLSFPSKPITIVCWSNPGSPNDLFAREIAKIGQKYFGQTVNVLTKAGADGAIGMAYLASQRADGHTLSTITSSQTFGMAYGLIPFKPSQFTYIVRVEEDPFLIAVRADSQFRDLNDFFAYGKKNPGKLTISGFGTASAHFLAFATLKTQAGNPDIRWIAYEGGADAVVAALGGHVSAVHTNFSVVREHLKAGKMRALGVSPVRLALLPDVKSYREQGYDSSAIQWRGLMGPGGMPPDLVMRVRALLDKTVADPEFKSYLQNTGDQLAAMEPPISFQRFVEDEVKANATLIKTLNLAARR